MPRDTVCRYFSAKSRRFTLASIKTEVMTVSGPLCHQAETGVSQFGKEMDSGLDLSGTFYHAVRNVFSGDWVLRLRHEGSPL